MGLADWIFPKKCIGCGKDGKYICESCEVGMWEEEQICPICCRNSRYGESHTNCKGEMDGLSCHFAYEGMIKQVITDAKYRYYYHELEEIITRCQALWDRPEFSRWNEFMKEGPILVPIPLHPEREKFRGFNQAEIIAKLIAGSLKLEVSRILVRIKETDRQVGKNREERLNSMKDAFLINNSLTSHSFNKEGTNLKNVILVDDVWTTGTTMRECAKTIKKAYPEAKIWGWVIAR